MIKKFLKWQIRLRPEHVPDPKKVRGAYVKTFSTPTGKVVLDDLIASYGAEVFDKDPIAMARNVGRREVVESIVLMLEEYPHEH